MPIDDARPPSPLAPSAFARGMWVFLAAFNLLAFAFSAWMLSLSRRHYVERAEITTQNLARVLEQNVTGTLRQIDLVLLSIKDEAERPLGALRSQDMDAFIQIRFARLECLAALEIADRDGRITRGFRHPGRAPAEVSREAFFLRLKETPQAGLVISKPTRGPDGAWGIILARRLEQAGGGFAGAVFATLPTHQLTRAMAQVDVGRRGSVSLRGEDLGLLARYPDAEGQQQMTGDTRIQGAYLEAVRSERPFVSFTATSVLDGLRRTYTLRRTEQPRFFILVGQAREEYLRAWYHQVAFTAVAALGLLSVTLGLGLMARSALQRGRLDQIRLADEEAKFRLLAENAMDVVWSTDSEGNLTYVSPSITSQRGWTPEEFMELNFGPKAMTRETTDRIRERLATLPLLTPGSQPFEKDLLEAVVMHKDGHEIQVEVRWRILWAEDGRVLGFQGVARDITERKSLESERESLIQELTRALAEVKRLSGMLPICSQCKKVRNDQGYWSQIETYLSEHTEATFTHGVCPECAQKFRNDILARRAQRPKGEGS